VWLSCLKGGGRSQMEEDIAAPNAASGLKTGST
jgi:hypothetical protein